MHLRLANPSDVSRIVALERLPSSRVFVGQWAEERHRIHLASGDARYFVSDSESGGLAAYAILRGLNEDSQAIELKRIVVAEPGKGLGRSILSELVRIAFEELHAHRLFLDVYEDNARARHLYETFGFQYEGILREAALRDGVWCNLRLMALLEHEYKVRNQISENQKHRPSRLCGAGGK
ncbi:MAG TPA: GNAT family protein [Terracidiphilus sp.]|nr:GNAT family protein [Terracidiphilus sp.]